MRRQITDKFLGEVVEVGRFVMALGLGGLITWVLTVSAAAPAAHLHDFTGASVLLLCITVAGAALWVIGAVIKPDPPRGTRIAFGPEPPPDAADGDVWVDTSGPEDQGAD